MLDIRTVLGGSMSILHRPGEKHPISGRFLFFLILIIVCIVGVAILWKHNEAKDDKYVYELKRSTGYLEQIITYCEKCYEEPQECEDSLGEVVKNLTYLELSVNNVGLLYGGNSRPIASSLYEFCDEINALYGRTGPSTDYSYVGEVKAASEAFLDELIGEEGNITIEDFVRIAEQYGNRLDLIALPML